MALKENKENLSFVEEVKAFKKGYTQQLKKKSTVWNLISVFQVY